MSASTLHSRRRASSASIDLVDEADKGIAGRARTVVAYRANRRSGTANTKTRGEVSGSGKKLVAPEGHRPRPHGQRRPASGVGGGVVFGPQPRDYSKKVLPKRPKARLPQAR